MKLSETEKRILVAALSYAIAHAPNTIDGWCYSNLRQKIVAAIRNGAA